MAKNINFDDVDGVWRTVGGRRIFIRNGQDLSSAMKESGKFNLSKKQKEAGEKLNKNAENGVREDIKTFLSGKEDYDGSREDFINDLSKEWGIDKDKVEDILHEESVKHPRLFKDNRPEGAKFSKMLEESGVKTFADEIKEIEKFNKNKKITKKDLVVGDIYQGADGYWNYDLKKGIESDYGLPYIWNKTKAGANLELKSLIQRENILNERKMKRNKE